MSEPNQNNDIRQFIEFVAYLVVAALFLSPAIIVVYPFSNSLTDAFEIALKRPEAWIASTAVWGILGYMWVTRKDW